MPHRPVVIMKFGGTSVATAEGRGAIASRVTEALEAETAPVVVVSAMGRAGAPYATDTLLGLVAALPGEAREQDLLASVGEVVSAVVVAHELRAAGIDAVALSGPEAGIRTDGLHREATITEIATHSLDHLLSHGRVPVVCGFQGVGPDGSITTLGRGGSDTTACALGVALDAREVQIYTDVDGVMTADPRTCEAAGVLERIGADELFQMARAGSRVVHTPAAELAVDRGVAMRVRNTYSDHPGTRVTRRTDADRVATAVSSGPEVARVMVSLPSPEGTPGHMRAQARVFSGMADAGVSLDMFTPLADRLVFTVPADAVETTRRVLEGSGLAFEFTEHLAKVTVIGAGMHGVPGVMARVATALDAAGVSVLQSADSHTTISVLVRLGDVPGAVRALHDGFGLGADDDRSPSTTGTTAR